MKPTAAVIAEGEAIRIPPGRDRVDWECELDVVIGRTASHVAIENAQDHIFGYTLQNDVSDRGGREDGRHGTDWLIAKGHDTFAPVGPFIVPREFVPDPQKLTIKFALSGRMMQDSNTDRMTHACVYAGHSASNILTLLPVDLDLDGKPRRGRRGARGAGLHEGGRRVRMHHREDRDPHQPGGGRSGADQQALTGLKASPPGLQMLAGNVGHPGVCPPTPASAAGEAHSRLPVARNVRSRDLLSRLTRAGFEGYGPLRTGGCTRP